MVDWHDTQAFFKEHWKPIVIVSLVVIAIIVGISITLVFVLKRKPVPSASVPVFNGPEVNGDPSQNSNQFGYPQVIPNPLPATIGFGRNMFVHDAGYIAVTLERSSTSPQSMLFYYTNLDGVIQGPQEIVMNFLPSGYKVCNGAFAPIFNITNEVYYLFVSVGPIGANGNMYPAYVVLFSLNTAVTSNVWALSNITTTYSKTLGTTTTMRLPSSSFTWPNSSIGPWYGTFGAQIQVVLDDNEAITKQSLYISGSEFDPNLPGGNVYWYVLQNNNPSPSIVLLFTIQDAKLLMMKNQGGCPSGCPSCTGGCATIDNTSEDICTNGFGSAFYVTSGSRSNNIMVIANSTAQDNCVLAGSNQPCAPKGYIQGYLLVSQGGSQSWAQPMSGSNTFLYRYIGAMSDPNLIGSVAYNGDSVTFGGFGNSVTIVSGNLIVGQGQPNKKSECTFLVYNWAAAPFQDSQLTPIGTIDPTNTGATAPFSMTAMYPINTLRYNQGVKTIADGSNQLLATSWYCPAQADVIAVMNLGDDSFTSFTAAQTLGSGYSSQTPVACTSSGSQSLVGFAQGTYTWISRTGATVRLATNDPYHAGGSGRIIIFTRKRQG